MAGLAACGGGGEQRRGGLRRAKCLPRSPCSPPQRRQASTTGADIGQQALDKHWTLNSAGRSPVLPQERHEQRSGMSTHPPTFLVLRVWWEPSADGPQWRASLYNPQGQTRQHFTAPWALLRCLLGVIGLASAERPQPTD